MADEIRRMQDYTASDINDNIAEVREARGEYDSLDDRLDNIEGGGPSPSNPIASNSVSPMTGYSKSSSSTPGGISTDDTLNAAIGKLEKRTELNENNILSVADQSTQYNIVPIKSTITTGSASVTATVAADKSITIEITGTTSSNIGFEISDNFTIDTNTEYVMTGCPSAGATRLVLQQAASPYNWIGQQYNNQAEAVTSNYSFVRYYVFIYSGSSGTITIKPMLTPKSLWDKGFTQFQPYALPNNAISSSLKECVDNGAKNLVAISDSTITGSNYVFNNVPCNIPAGSYVFSYTSNQSAQGDVEFVVKNSGGTTITSKTVTSSSGRVSIPFTISETGSKLTLYSVRAGTYSNFMICEKSLYDVSSTFEPYALSNAELTAKKANASDVPTKLNKYITNATKTYTLDDDTQYIITINSYGTYGMFVAFKYSDETTPRLYEIKKSSNFDSNITISAVASSSDISIAPVSSSTWYISSCIKL